MAGRGDGVEAGPTAPRQLRRHGQMDLSRAPRTVRLGIAEGLGSASVGLNRRGKYPPTKPLSRRPHSSRTATRLASAPPTVPEAFRGAK